MKYQTRYHPAREAGDTPISGVSVLNVVTMAQLIMPSMWGGVVIPVLLRLNDLWFVALTIEPQSASQATNNAQAAAVYVVPGQTVAAGTSRPDATRTCTRREEHLARPRNPRHGPLVDDRVREGSLMQELSRRVFLRNTAWAAGGAVVLPVLSGGWYTLAAAELPGYFEREFGITDALCRKVLAEALGKGGDFADLYFEHTIAN